MLKLQGAEPYVLYETTNVGHTLRQLREAHNMTVGRMAKQLGRDRGTITRWESGKTKIPLIETIQYLGQFKISLAISTEHMR